MGTTDYQDLGGRDLGQPTGLSWLNIYPDGFKHLLQYVNNRLVPIIFSHHPFVMCEILCGDRHRDLRALQQNITTLLS
jgi:hypothetical protein